MLFSFITLRGKIPNNNKIHQKSTFCEVLILSAETPGILLASLQGGQAAGAAPQGVTALSLFLGLYLE